MSASLFLYASLVLTAPAAPLLTTSAVGEPATASIPQPELAVADSKGIIKREFKPFTIEAFVDELRNKRDFAVFSAKPGAAESLMQEPALSIILQDPAMATYNIYRLDMVTQPDEAAKLYIEKPATLMIFKSGKEVSRTVRIIDPDALSKLLLPEIQQPQNGQLGFEE
jgi:hypothetical protein